MIVLLNLIGVGINREIEVAIGLIVIIIDTFTDVGHHRHHIDNSLLEGG